MLSAERSIPRPLRPDASPTLTRRTFLRAASLASASALTLPLLLQACGGTPAAPASPASGAGTARGTLAGGLKMPTYVPFQGPKPNLPATDSGVPPGYFNYPKDLVKTVTKAPGSGQDVNAASFFIGAPSTPVEQNAGWQEMNKQLNANIKFQLYSVTDWFPTRLPVLIAGNQLPDMFLEAAQASTIQNEPEFLESQCADLTPYLSGDNIKAFPNLANLPSYMWQTMVFNGKIFGVPRAKGGLDGFNGSTLFAKGKLLDQVGVSQIKSADDMTKAMKAVTIPGQRYGIGGFGTGAVNPIGWFLQIFGAPNQWRNDNGKLTKDFETPEYKAALAYFRSLWDAGYIHPDSPTGGPANGFYTEKIAFWPNSFIADDFNWNASVTADPQFSPRVITPFSADGKAKPVYYTGIGEDGRTVLRKASPDRIKELLGILNFWVAPFGSQENLLLNYGVKDTEYTLDANGNPTPTPQGAKDVLNTYLWFQFVTPPDALYNPRLGDYVKVGHQARMESFAIALANPVVGLYSKTDASQGTVLTRKVLDGIQAICYGRENISTFDQLVSDWRTAGGDTIRAEYQQALQAS